jgi:hypothetical protein
VHRFGLADSGDIRLPEAQKKYKNQGRRSDHRSHFDSVSHDTPLKPDTRSD